MLLIPFFMKKIFCLMVIVFLAGGLFSAQKAEAAGIAGASASLVDELSKPDLRIKQLELALKYYKSPLADYSADFVQMADKYGIDWRLLPAISGVESTFGKHYIAGTFNAYGWGGGTIRFESWKDSIEKVSKALSEKYYGRGLDTPYKIAPVYCPPSKVWAGNVTFFMEKMEGFNGKDALSAQLVLD